MISALYNIKEKISYDQHFLSNGNNSHLPEEEIKQISAIYKISQEELRKFKDIACLIVYPKAIEILNEYYIDTGKIYEDYFSDHCCEYEFNEALVNLHKSYLEKLIEVAKKDLNIKRLINVIKV